MRYSFKLMEFVGISRETLVLSTVLLFIVILLPLLSVLVKALYELWWNPIRIRRTMAEQGIKGPSYRFIHGSTREASRMLGEVAHKPIQGLSHDIFGKVQPHLHAWIEAYGRNYLSWYGSQARLVITEVELGKEILNNKDNVYPKTRPSGFEKKLLGIGVAFSEGEKWERQRKLSHHAFHGENLKAMVPAMVDSVRTMLAKWEKQQQQVRKEINVFQEFKVMLSEVISRTAFGTSYVEGSDILRMMADLAEITSKNYLNVRIPGISYIWKTADEKESDRLEMGIRAAILNIANKREEKKSAGDVDGFGIDFLAQLLKAYHGTEKSESITVDELVDECKTFYFAGHEASNASLVWTVFLLAVHRDWQEEARKEVLHIFGDRDPSFDGILKLRTVGRALFICSLRFVVVAQVVDHLRYLQMTMILNESLRLYTPGVGFIRKVTRQSRLGRLVLPAGIQVFVSSLKLHHDPEIWGNDAHLFKPDRFSEGVAKATNNRPGAFIPFGLGPRNCVGMNFATTEAKITLSMILQCYYFKLSPTYVHCPILRSNVQPLHGIQVIFQPLTH